MSQNNILNISKTALQKINEDNTLEFIENEKKKMEIKVKNVIEKWINTVGSSRVKLPLLMYEKDKRPFHPNKEFFDKCKEELESFGYFCYYNDHKPLFYISVYKIPKKMLLL